jgi:hypothetical protein
MYNSLCLWYDVSRLQQLGVTRNSVPVALEQKLRSEKTEARKKQYVI